MDGLEDRHYVGYIYPIYILFIYTLYIYPVYIPCIYTLYIQYTHLVRLLLAGKPLRLCLGIIRGRATCFALGYYRLVTILLVG